jgi:hypothetical protein
VLQSAAVVSGSYTDAAGQLVDLATRTIVVPQSGGAQYYRIRSNTPFTIKGITLSGGNVVLTYN